MRNFLSSVLLVGAMIATPLLAQPAPTAPKPKPASYLEIAVTYDAARSNTAGGSSFWLQGGSVQLHAHFWHGLGAVADVAGLHQANVHSSGVGLDLVTATFGPRYTWSPAHGRFSLYGQALGGVVNGLNSVFPNPMGAETNATGTAMQLGGGVNVKLTHRVALRAIEADWLRTDLPNSTTNVQNNLRLGAGFVFRF